MSEESGGERGLLTDIFIFLLIIGLGLAAIYFTGNWPWFMNLVNRLMEGVFEFAAMFTENVKSVADVVPSAAEEVSSL